MRICGYLAGLVMIGVSLLSAQQTPVDAVKLAAEIGASYYHPDGIPGLDCGATVDYGSVFKQLGQTPPDELRKQLAGISIKVRAMADRTPQIDIAWRDGAPANQANIENSLKQAIGGFFQMYWPFLGSSIAGGKKENLHIETRPGGGYLWHEGSQAMNMTLEIDGDNVPGKLSVDTPSMKVTVEFHFAPSQDPKPGDLRRLTFLDFAEQVGTTSINGRLSLDYQDVGGFNVPRHLSLGIGGAYAIPMEFSNCSLSKAAPVGAEPK
jgi:hypothetical protein